ncbi:MAG: PH domain-containing protein [Nitrososphaeraceae archaeon]
MPFGFGKKEEDVPFTTDLTDKDDLEEIRKISSKLDQSEKVLFVAKQSRNIPGGAIISSPNTVFATDKRLIIRNPTMLGMRENVEDISYDKITSVKLEKGLFSSTVVIRAPGLSELTRLSQASGLIAWGRGEDGTIDALPKEKAEQLVKIIKERMEAVKKLSHQSTITQQTSIADELSKLAKLKEQGIISEDEFLKMKQELIKKM